MDPYEALEKGDWRELEEFVHSNGYNTDFMPLERMVINSEYFTRAYFDLIREPEDTTPRNHWYKEYDDVFTLVKRNGDTVYYTDCWSMKNEKRMHFSAGRFPEITDDHYVLALTNEENNLLTLAHARSMKLLDVGNGFLSSVLGCIDRYLTRSDLKHINSYYGKDAIDFINSSSQANP